jgi:separase
MLVDFLKNEENLQTLNTALGTLAQLICVTDAKSSQRDSLRKYASQATDTGHQYKKDSYSYCQSHEHIYFAAYFDSLEFVCKILLLHANAVWKNFSEGKTVPSLGNTTCVLMALDQFIDSSLVVYR